MMERKTNACELDKAERLHQPNMQKKEAIYGLVFEGVFFWFIIQAINTNVFWRSS